MMASSSTNNLTRRALLAGAAAVVALPARALTSAQATQLIDAAVDDIQRAINSGKSQSALYGDFERIFRRYADVGTIARSALGPPARSASSGEINAFTDAFVGYLARKYGKRFREFVGGEISVTGARNVNNFQEVTAQVKLRGQSPFAVSFMVSDRSGRDLFFDLLIEGISLLKSERAEIGAMLDRRRGDITALVGDLRQAG
ncbi:MAG: ABC transporter substrate-binding protein [Pseudomonadota bacterium]